MKFLRDQCRLLDIEVDGGVGPSNIHTCVQVCCTLCLARVRIGIGLRTYCSFVIAIVYCVLQAGANQFVSGTAVANSDNPAGVLQTMKQVIDTHKH